MGWGSGMKPVESERIQKTSRSRRKRRVELWPITRRKSKRLPEKETEKMEEKEAGNEERSRGTLEGGRRGA